MRPPIRDRFIPPALPPSYAPAPTPPPPPSSSQVVLLAVVIVLFLLSAFISDMRRHRLRENRRRAAEAAAPFVPPRRALPFPRLEPTGHFEELRHLRQARAANPAVNRLPAFRYNWSAKPNVTAPGGWEECPVCLGAFQLGETVRLLPLCLHLYHVECIDPWLDAHSTCPICRSDTHPTVDVARRRPPV